MRKINNTDEAIKAIRATQLEYGIEDDWNLNRVVDFLKRMNASPQGNDDFEPLAHCMFPKE
jgi:hypothetical protein